MSTNWRIKCNDCEVETENSRNHGYDEIFELWYNRKILKAFRDADFYMLDFGGDDFSAEGAAFIANHYNHHLAAVSEYGESVKLFEKPETPDQKRLREINEAQETEEYGRNIGL